MHYVFIAENSFKTHIDEKQDISTDWLNYLRATKIILTYLWSWWTLTHQSLHELGNVRQVCQVVPALVAVV